MDTQETNNLEINWDEDDSQVVTTVENIVTAIENDTPIVEETPPNKEVTTTKEKTDTNEVVSEEINWDENEDDTPSDGDDKSKSNPKTDEPGENTTNLKVGIINTLKNKGYLDFELEDGNTLEDLDDEELEELIDEGLEASQDAAIEKVIKDLPQIGKNFLKVVAKGGDGMEYLSSLVENKKEVIDEALDLEDIENQKKVMSLKLKKEGYDEDYINTFIETLENSNKLKTTSSTEFKKMIAEQKEAEKEEQKRIDNIARQRREKENKDITEMKNFVTSKTEIQGVKISKKEQAELPEYMFRNSVKLDGGGATTKFWYELITGLKDKDNATLIAKIVKAGFKLDDIKKDLATNVSSNVRKEIQRQEGGKVSKVRIKSGEGKALHELI